MSHSPCAEIPLCVADPLCRCFPSLLLFSLCTLRSLPLSLWAASILVIFINGVFFLYNRRNTGGSDKDLQCFLYQPFSPTWYRKLLSQHRLVVSWNLRGTFTVLPYRKLHFQNRSEASCSSSKTDKPIHAQSWLQSFLLLLFVNNGC